MNETFPDRAAVLAKAAHLAEASGLTVLDRDFVSGGDRLDLVTVTKDKKTLVVIEVTLAEPGAVRAGAARIATLRLLEIFHAGAAWMHAHDDNYCDFRVDSAVLSPDGSGEVVPWQAGQNAEGAR